MLVLVRLRGHLLVHLTAELAINNRLLLQDRLIVLELLGAGTRAESVAEATTALAGGPGLLANWFQALSLQGVLSLLAACVVLLELLIELSQDTGSFAGNQALYNFLCNILRGSSQQIFQLPGFKLADDLVLFIDAGDELVFKLIQTAFLLEHVLDKPASTLEHLGKPALKPLPQGHLLAQGVARVLAVPDVVRDKRLYVHPVVLGERRMVAVVELLEAVLQAVCVLDEDVISSNENLGLFFLLLRSGRRFGSLELLRAEGGAAG